MNHLRSSIVGSASVMGVVGSVPMDDGVSKLRFLNPFTGETEPYFSEAQAHASMFVAAAQRIKDLEEQIEAIKSHLVL